MARTKHWLMIAGAGTIAAACTLSFDDSEVKPHDDASAGGTISTGGSATGGVAGQDASSGGGTGGAPTGGGGAPTGGGGAPTGGGGSPDGAAGAPSGGTGGTTTGGGGAPTGGGGAPTGGGGAPTGGGGAPTGGGGAPTGGGGTTSGGGGTGPVAPTPCPIGSDDFEDGVLNSMWSPWGPTPKEQGGQLQLVPLGTSTEYSGVATKLNGDVRQCAVWLEVPQVLTSQLETSVYLVLSAVSGQNVAFVQWEEGLLHVGFQGQGEYMQYSPTADRWWRINSLAGSTKYETSPDGKTWTTKKTTSTPASWVSGYAEIGAGTWKIPKTNLGFAVIDNFNK